MNKERNDKMFEVIKQFSELNEVQPQVDIKLVNEYASSLKKKGYSNRRIIRAVERKFNL